MGSLPPHPGSCPGRAACTASEPGQRCPACPLAPGRSASVCGCSRPSPLGPSRWRGWAKRPFPRVGEACLSSPLPGRAELALGPRVHWPAATHPPAPLGLETALRVLSPRQATSVLPPPPLRCPGGRPPSDPSVGLTASHLPSLSRRRLCLCCYWCFA